MKLMELIRLTEEQAEVIVRDERDVEVFHGLVCNIPVGLALCFEVKSFTGDVTQGIQDGYPEMCLYITVRHAEGWDTAREENRY